jgi:tetratricopeptide (TPR) repeat protein
MNIIDQYMTLVESERWTEGLPLIEEIISRGPHISTSWFNYGVCLSALARHGEAADKFLKAYELDPENYGAQYRAFRCLYEARDYERFLQLARRECEAMPEQIKNLVEDEHFGTLFTRPEFQNLLRDFEV